MPLLRKFCLPIFLLLLVLALAACSGDGDTGASSQASIQVNPPAPASELTEEIRSEPESVQEAYRFALANPDILKQVPCYCGCGSMGHKSNYQCYVSGFDADGKPQFDTHALGWSICVDITRDVMRMLDEGKTIPEIREAIDENYSKFGPSNMED